MSKNFTRSAAVCALALLGACAAAGATAAINQPPAEAPQEQAYAASAAHETRIASRVSCDIRTTRTAHGVLVEPVALARANFNGEYSLELTTSGGGNSSTINQGGPVSLDAGSSTTLGQSEVSLTRGGHLHVVLIMRDAHGELCRKVVTL